ncbi:MAG: alpha/beta fold hydrolase, partial [bacterium]|nr:alpha/beta fold hydrolase [bacterium]
LTLARLQLASNAPETRVARIAGAMERCGRATCLADFRACDAFDLRDRLGEIAVPTLVVCGSEDRMTPPKYSAFLCEAITGARLAHLEGAGHVPQLEQPEPLARLIAEFAATLGEGAGTVR